MFKFHVFIPKFFVEYLIDPEQDFSSNLDQWTNFYEVLPTRDILEKTLSKNCDGYYEEEEAEDEEDADLASAIMRSVVLDNEENRDPALIQWSYSIKDAKEKSPKGKPFSIVSLVSTRDKTVTSNIVYGPAGKCIFQIDFAKHGENGPGHWHDLIEGELDHSPNMESHAYPWLACPWMWLCVRLDDRYKDYRISPLVAEDGSEVPYVKIAMLHNEEFVNPKFVVKKPIELKQRKTGKTDYYVFLPDAKTLPSTSTTQERATLEEASTRDVSSVQEAMDLINTVQGSSSSEHTPIAPRNENKNHRLSAPPSQFLVHSNRARPPDAKAQGYLEDIQKLLASPQALCYPAFCKEAKKYLQPYLNHIKPLDLQARGNLRLKYEELSKILKEKCSDLTAKKMEVLRNDGINDGEAIQKSPR